ncbi:hypothetical protein BASA50_008087 [Batrachochytrium salamandrivorans]|uniref:HTH La-type RNA-binding domain-containing protein n=1 Tax=Batrachochytrium salamandrivorans TaxID=1357716 RepID=A0ABQ8F862_9FUNG|nr:hypothetical protein BASA62_010412 [Batrachochytrium salamandrivorans]KAH6583260.1 hypothetical protein BASA60_001532 [Batrachochytrium salamandrivorans]KAH6592471.1 hypothetical protein BASA50_008087 [Batrachochytrium salamandrivorans]KAJ1330240.1 hypothetical protein BSLG_009659 [Batrachochytrium salamandrivorans]
MSDTTKAAIFLQLVAYLDNANYNGTIANLPKSFADSPLLAQGWIPLRDLVSFKRMKDMHLTPASIAEAIVFIPSALFELSPDAAYLRRISEFDADKVTKELSNHSIMARYVVEAVGFAHDVSTAEVEVYFGRFGVIRNVSTTVGVSSCDQRYNTTFLVEFKELDSMVQTLAATHTYEDTVIQVHAKSKSNVNTDVVALSTAKKSYPKGKVVEFRVVSDVAETLERPMIQALFEKFASVKSVEFVKGNMIGYVQFKKPVAEEAISVIMSMGGIRIDDEVIQLRALSGDEERLYWTVVQEKLRINGPRTSAGVDLEHAVKFAKQTMAAHKGRSKKGKTKGKTTGRAKNSALTGRYHTSVVSSLNADAPNVSEGNGDMVDAISDTTLQSALGIKRGKSGVKKAGASVKPHRNNKVSKHRGTPGASSMKDLLEGFDRI